MKTMAAAKFKEQCLAVLDSVDAEGIIVMKHGKPVAKVVLIEADASAMNGNVPEARARFASSWGAGNQPVGASVERTCTYSRGDSSG